MLNKYVTFRLDFGDGPILTAGKVLAVTEHNRGKDQSYTVEILGMAVTLHIWADETLPA